MHSMTIKAAHWSGSHLLAILHCWGAGLTHRGGAKCCLSLVHNTGLEKISSDSGINKRTCILI